MAILSCSRGGYFKCCVLAHCVTLRHVHPLTHTPSLDHTQHSMTTHNTYHSITQAHRHRHTLNSLNLSSTAKLVVSSSTIWCDVMCLLCCFLDRYCKVKHGYSMIYFYDLFLFLFARGKRQEKLTNSTWLKLIELIIWHEIERNNVNSTILYSYSYGSMQCKQL